MSQNVIGTNPLKLAAVKGYPNLIKISAPERKEAVMLWLLLDIAMTFGAFYLLGLPVGIAFAVVFVLYSTVIIGVMNATSSKLAYFCIYWVSFIIMCAAAAMFSPLAGALLLASYVPSWIGNWIGRGHPFSNSLQRKDSLRIPLHTVINPELLI